MRDLLQAFDGNCREITDAVNAISARLSAPQTTSGPAFYSKVIRDIADIERKWKQHLQLLSHVSLTAAGQSDNGMDVLNGIEASALGIAEQLRNQSSAGWARSPELGVSTIRFCSAHTLASLLQLMEKEKEIVTALLRQPAQERALAKTAAIALAIA